MDTSVLWNLGLTKNEIKIYLTLLDEGSSTAGIITEKTGIHRRNVYDSIERLIEKGIVGYIVVKGRKHFEAVDPKYWIYHSAKLFKHYPDTQFVYINAEGWKVPKEWKEYSNCSVDTYQGLETFLVDYPI